MHGPEACGRNTSRGLEWRAGLRRRDAPPSALAAATTGGGAEQPTPHLPAPVSGDRSPLGLGGAEDVAQVRGKKAAGDGPPSSLDPEGGGRCWAPPPARQHPPPT
ncbi:hypothetical protein NDU88_000791 [Pleurodeles waltl]|uniref:Uncharacterized protein n=1 Tax=Pleurodeles waltl TaxID=8319 RepID=A0AAV7V9X8_PLEWA|nr:hypothetical protein NDU88_000791 [Pleurodeles waltl]